MLLDETGLIRDIAADKNGGIEMKAMTMAEIAASNLIERDMPLVQDARNVANIKNKDARKMADRITKSCEAVSSSLERVNRSIIEKRNYVKMLEGSLEEFSARGSYKYEQKLDRLNKEREALQAFEAERDKIISSVMPPDEFKTIVDGLLEAHSIDKTKRIKEIRTHIDAISSLLREQYIQSHAEDTALTMLITELNTRDGDEYIETMRERDEAFHYSGFMQPLTLVYGIGWITDELEHLEKLSNQLDRL